MTAFEIRSAIIFLQAGPLFPIIVYRIKECGKKQYFVYCNPACSIAVYYICSLSFENKKKTDFASKFMKQNSKNFIKINQVHYIYHHYFRYFDIKSL